MRDNHPPKPPVLPLMTAEDRELWLSARNAPEGMHLIHDSELAKIMGGTLLGNAQLTKRNAELALIMTALGSYWENEPTVADAAAAAVFDAKRWKDAAEKAQVRLTVIRDTLEAVCKSLALAQPANRFDVVGAFTEAAAAITEIETAKLLHRERRKP